MRARASGLLFVLLLGCQGALHAQRPPTQAPQAFKYAEVTDRIAGGGQPAEGDFRALAEKGYQAVINLRTDKENVDLAAEEKLVTSLGMKYFNIPVTGRSPSEEQALEFLKRMDDLNDQKVFVHCTIGVRAGAFLLVYLVLKERMEADKAEQAASSVGLTPGAFRDFARQVIEHQKQLAAPPRLLFR